MSWFWDWSKNTAPKTGASSPSSCLAASASSAESVGTTTWTLTSARTSGLRRRIKSSSMLTNSKNYTSVGTATNGPWSPNCSPGAPTTPSKTTGTPLSSANSKCRTSRRKPLKTTPALPGSSASQPRTETRLTGSRTRSSWNLQGDSALTDNLCW